MAVACTAPSLTPDGEGEGAEIVEKARRSWLKNNEVLLLLQNQGTWGLPVCYEPPQRPDGGQLFLFNRSQCRNFRKDGHHWSKKDDGKTVKETHEKLKVGTEKKLNCYYAHAESGEGLQRRCYWQLDDENLVLVHYLCASSSRAGVTLGSRAAATADVAAAPRPRRASRARHAARRYVADSDLEEGDDEDWVPSEGEDAPRAGRATRSGTAAAASGPQPLQVSDAKAQAGLPLLHEQWAAFANQAHALTQAPQQPPQQQTVFSGRPLDIYSHPIVELPTSPSLPLRNELPLPLSMQPSASMLPPLPPHAAAVTVSAPPQQQQQQPYHSQSHASPTRAHAGVLMMPTRLLESYGHQLGGGGGAGDGPPTPISFLSPQPSGLLSQASLGALLSMPSLMAVATAAGLLDEDTLAAIAEQQQGAAVATTAAAASSLAPQQQQSPGQHAPHSLPPHSPLDKQHSSNAGRLMMELGPEWISQNMDISVAGFGSASPFWSTPNHSRQNSMLDRPSSPSTLLVNHAGILHGRSASFGRAFAAAQQGHQLDPSPHLHVHGLEAETHVGAGGGADAAAVDPLAHLALSFGNDGHVSSSLPNTSSLAARPKGIARPSSFGAQLNLASAARRSSSTEDEGMAGASGFASTAASGPARRRNPLGVALPAAGAARASAAAAATAFGREARLAAARQQGSSLEEAAAGGGSLSAQSAGSYGNEGEEEDDVPDMISPDLSIHRLESTMLSHRALPVMDEELTRGLLKHMSIDEGDAVAAVNSVLAAPATKYHPSPVAAAVSSSESFGSELLTEGTGTTTSGELPSRDPSITSLLHDMHVAPADDPIGQKLMAARALHAAHAAEKQMASRQ